MRRRPTRIVAALVCVALTASVLSTLASFISIDAIHHHTTETTVQSTATWLREAAASTSVALRNTTAAILGRDNCTDSDSNCPQWAVQGECTANPTFMVSNCRMSCGQCGAVQARWAQRGACADRSSFCGQWAAVGECDSNPNYMRANCPVTCHLCQSGDCHDSDQVRCAARAAAGECRRAPEVMYGECRWSCKWCAMRENARCKRPPGTRPAAVGGTVNHVFSRAALMERYLPRVLSRDPWVIVFEDFLSQGEAERIIRVGGARGWGRSQAGDGVQAVRTSSTAWCDPGSCQSDAVLASIRSRIANVTLVPEQNAEHMQVLRYEVGQFYKTHHDQNAPLTAAWGPRMYTFFMYLNDGVEGGETNFPRLNVSVTPRRGRALLWPSVLDDDPTQRDDRTEHQSVAVRRGTKYASNYWLHMYDFQSAVARGCSNTEVFGNW